MTHSSEQTGVAAQLEHSNHVQQTFSLYTLVPTMIRKRMGPLKNTSTYSTGSQRHPTIVATHQNLECEEVDVVTDDPAPETDVDFRRKHARHGWGLLQNSLSEARYEDAQSQDFSRQLYINSLSHLLQGLPSDLTDNEVNHLQQALPHSLHVSNQTKAIEAGKQHSTILHRGVSTAIVLFCLFIRLSLPYIRYFLTIAHNYERTYHVTERALALSVDTADSLGKRSMEIAASAMDNRFVISGVRYCIEGICGGLTEGLSEGIRAIES